MTKTTKNHYIEISIRLILFLTAIFTNTSFITANETMIQDIVSTSIWIFFMGLMILRLIPNKDYSAGNQKMFKKNFVPTKQKSIKRDYKTAMKIFSIWFLVNAVIGVLYLKNIITAQTMFYITLTYSICDISCILWYCPIQRWSARNRCCNTCRIYNWDFAMIFTPLILIPNIYNYTLVGVSLIVALIWEITYFKHPERFHEQTNDFINCKNCKEKVCKNKLRLIVDKNNKKIN